MSFWDVILLAVIQGIAEFLPVSSSGHLVLCGHWLGIQEATGTLNIMLHAGTLMSILVFYWHRVLRLVSSDRKVMVLLLIGTIPGALSGIWIKKYNSGLMENPWLSAAMLMVTGVILGASRFLNRREGVDYQHASVGMVLGIGCAQAFAILPGISRSGSTIVAGQFLGLKPDASATFSFLLALPIIAGATVYEIISLSKDTGSENANVTLLLVGAAISFAVGYGSLLWLANFIQKGKFHWFAWWCIPFGVLSLLLLAIFG
ncbi:MAG: undecaprenyl-diphosphate phosphatase [Planctomycetota bacterium]|nr:undecaprenyl-diphosphate phosphatase [Planctomycetota bacterium]